MTPLSEKLRNCHLWMYVFGLAGFFGMLAADRTGDWFINSLVVMVSALGLATIFSMACADALKLEEEFKDARDLIENIWTRPMDDRVWMRMHYAAWNVRDCFARQTEFLQGDKSMGVALTGKDEEKDVEELRTIRRNMQKDLDAAVARAKATFWDTHRILKKFKFGPETSWKPYLESWDDRFKRLHLPLDQPAVTELESGGDAE